MSRKPMTKEEFEQIKQKYEDALQARAQAIKTMRDGLGWSFTAIADHFGISRQAAEKIYKGAVREDETDT